MSTSSRTPRRSFLIPEVVQTSAMDCGPAALKCMLQGFGIRTQYSRLREACQTDVDGTSIDTIEEVAQQLGLVAEQIMIPLDHVLLSNSTVLPAIAIVRLPSSVTHFVVVWRRHGRILQVMDPGKGRLWPTCRRFLDDLYVHEMEVPAGKWREWAGSAAACGAFKERLDAVGCAQPVQKRIFQEAHDDPGALSLAALDAAARLTGTLVRSRGIARGGEASRVFERVYRCALENPPGENGSPAEPFWSARVVNPDADGSEQVLMRGAVLVSVRGKRAATAVPVSTGSGPDEESKPAGLPPDLAAALTEPSIRPGIELLRMLRADGFLTPLSILVGLAVAAAGVVVEVLLFRGLIDLGRELPVSGHRLGALGAILVFLIALLLLELPVATGLLRMGRRLEIRLRSAFLETLPRLGNRYFASRLTSDMAYRCHGIHRVRELPLLGALFLRASFELVLTTAGIAWLDPASAPLALAAALIALAVPLAAQPILVERDLRVRNHNGALSSFYFDAFRGLVSVRTHGAGRSVRQVHADLLAEWVRAGREMLRPAVAVEGLTALTGLALAAFILFGHIMRGGEGGSVLLLVYWALSLPVIGQRLAIAARTYPTYRNVTLELLDPLRAVKEQGRALAQDREEKQAAAGTTAEPSFRPSGAPALSLGEVTVRASGHTILEKIDLTVNPGEHVAIVGPSGAGKSTLVGLFLGWHQPAAGQVQVDGAVLDGPGVEGLRQVTAWVDPAVHLWNRTFLENLQYGSRDERTATPVDALDGACLMEVLEKLPDGLQTSLGEGGGLLSGGEGQRVRFGRALARKGVRLVILDEPFRGLDRALRRKLLAHARAQWRDATLLCITHDVSETLAFERVVMLEKGRIREQGAPSALRDDKSSLYRSMLDREEEVHDTLWADAGWRKLRLDRGKLTAGGGS